MEWRYGVLTSTHRYLAWNLHEPEPLQYNFAGDLDIRRFILTAQKSGLLVVLRPGPFIDAEVDMVMYIHVSACNDFCTSHKYNIDFYT